VELELLVAEMSYRTLAQIFYRKPEDYVHHQHMIHDHIFEAETLRILAIEVSRVEIHGDAGEEAVIAFVDRPAPMMLEKMAWFEVLEVVATLDIAHRHVNPAAFRVVVGSRKILKPRPFFMEFPLARQPTDWARQITFISLTPERQVLSKMGQTGT
jgi:hypothetical protein